MVLSLLALLATVAVAQDECPDPDRNLTWARDAVLQFGFAEADTYLLEAEKGFGCTTPASPAQAARMHLIRAARFEYDGDSVSRDRYLASARGADGTFFEAAFGDEFKAVWAAATPAGEGELSIPALPGGWLVWIDGARSELEGPLPSGPHLLQIGPDAKEVRWAKAVGVEVGSAVKIGVPASLVPVVTEELVTEPVAVGAASEPAVKRPRKTGLLVAGLATAAVGAGAAAGTWSMASGTERSSTKGTALLVANTAGWGVVGVGVGLVALGFTPKKQASIGMGPTGVRLTGRW
ncbi:MAG: hypothetical protein KC912_14845 [Proteobacteria bacterium]|nr:hypothetical protein [Pseudomonadota bacterium]